MPNYEWFDSDDEKDLLGYESDQEFVQASEINDEKVNLNDESEQVESESQSGSDEFDASGYYVGKKVRAGVYEFSDSSEPFSGFGIVLKETETDSSSYDSDVTSKPSTFRDEFNDVQSEPTVRYCDDPHDLVNRFFGTEMSKERNYENKDDYYIATDSTREPSNGHQKRKVLAVRDFPAGCGVGSANLIDGNLAPERLESSSIKRRDVSAKRDFPVGCGSTVPSIKPRSVSAKRDFPIGCGSSAPSLPCIKKRNVSVKPDSPVGCGSIVSGIKRRSVSAKRHFPIGCGGGRTGSCQVG